MIPQNYNRSTIVAMEHNAYGLAKWGNYTHKSRLEEPKFNLSTKV